MLAGAGDPLTFLDRIDADWAIQTAVIRKAREIQGEQRSEELGYLIRGMGASVGNRVAEILSKVIGMIIHSIRQG